MFGLFKKSQPSIKVVNKVWMSKEAKYNACRQMLKLDRFIVFITWFEETRREMNSMLNLEPQNINVYLESELLPDMIRNRVAVFAEHYPLSSVEQNGFKRLSIYEANVLVSLDEPFFAKFGGEKTIEMMKKLGMNEDEVLDHSFITRAIQNAQDKLAKKIVVEKPANSQKEWFDLNA